MDIFNPILSIIKKKSKYIEIEPLNILTHTVEYSHRSQYTKYHDFIKLTCIYLFIYAFFSDT